MLRSFMAVAAGLLTAAGAHAQTLPTAPVRNVSESFFGTTVDDPYRYMEDVKNPEVAAWMKAHSDFAHATLKAIPGRDAMLQSLLKYDDSVAARVADTTRAKGDIWFYEKRGAKEDQFKLYMRRGLNGAETLLVDPEALQKKTGKPHAINYFTPSPDGRYVAYGISAGGSEAAVLNVIDTKTGRTVGRPVDRADFGVGSWAPDGKSLYMNRLQKLTKGMPGTEKYQRSQMLHLRVGAAAPDAKPVFWMNTPGVEMTPAETPFVGVTYDGRWALGFVANGVQREVTLYAAPASTIASAKPGWKKLFDASAQITRAEYHDGMLYLLSHQGASRSQVLRAKLDGFDLAHADVVVPASERVVTGIGAASDALYIEARDGNVKRLYKLPYGSAAASEVALPVQGSFRLADEESSASAANPELPGVVIDLQGWVNASQIYAVDADGGVTNTGLQPKGPYDAPDDVVATEVSVKSHDGAMVPMSIIHKKGVKLDGSNPTLLYGYAAYGITEEPYYSIGRLAWMDAGGVFAIANPRGSGVFGEDWYKGGYKTTKPNTWKDFIACAEYLIAQGYTKPAKLGILGGSAGGILVGRSFTERPDLFAVAVPVVGALDTLRFEVTPNGVPNIPEFGTRKTEEGFRALLAMSTYDHITPRTAYPAVMFVAGVNDPRVEVWESTKTAARLMAATTSSKPVLLRLDYESGHGIGNTKMQTQEQRADIFAFMLWQMGATGYQPAH